MYENYTTENILLLIFVNYWIQVEYFWFITFNLNYLFKLIKFNYY